MVQEEIDRALLRGGITDSADVRLRLEDSQLPNEVDVLSGYGVRNSLRPQRTGSRRRMGYQKRIWKSWAPWSRWQSQSPRHRSKTLRNSLDLFDFAPGAHSPAEYGKYMIQQSGHFDYDENLDAFYDYEKYGTERMNAEDGMFTDRGYIAYKGYYQHGGSDERQPEQPHGDGRAFTMIIQAELKCKQTGCEADPCAVDKVIELPSPRFRQFSRALLADYDFIAENKDAIRHDDDARHCLLILDAEGTDGFLVDPQGHNYARYSAFVPNARSLLTPDMGIDRSYLSPAEPWRDESRDEMLRMTLRVNGKPDYTLVLPADEEYLDAVKDYLRY